MGFETDSVREYFAEYADMYFGANPETTIEDEDDAPAPLL